MFYTCPTFRELGPGLPTYCLIKALVKKKLEAGKNVACAQTKLNLVNSVCEIAPKSLFWSSSGVPRFEYAPRLAS